MLEDNDMSDDDEAEESTKILNQMKEKANEGLETVENSSRC